MTSKAKPTNMRGFANFTFAVCVKSGGEPFGACTSDEQCPLSDKIIICARRCLCLRVFYSCSFCYNTNKYISSLFFYNKSRILRRLFLIFFLNCVRWCKHSKLKLITERTLLFFCLYQQFVLDNISQDLWQDLCENIYVKRPPLLLYMAHME